jgi:hypothetical protein
MINYNTMNALLVIGYYISKPWFWFVDRLYALAVKLSVWNENIKVKRMARQLPKEFVDPNDARVDPYTNIAKQLRNDWNKGTQPMILGFNTITSEDEARRILSSV